MFVYIWNNNGLKILLSLYEGSQNILRSINKDGEDSSDGEVDAEKYGEMNSIFLLSKTWGKI